MDAFYILRINKFNTASQSYVNTQQTAMEGIYDDCPTITFEQIHNLTISNKTLIKYDLTTEKSVRQKGRALGSNTTFEQFISINESCFYYYKHLNIIILHCSKDVFNQFYKAFKDHYDFEFKKVSVDFDYIITNQRLLGIEGIWLGKIDDINISSLLLLGNNVEDSMKYRELRAEGAEISNITMIYDFDNQQKKVMITKDGGVVFYTKEIETNALLIIEHIYETLMS